MPTYTSLTGLPAGNNFLVADTTNSQVAATSGDPYTGPVPGIADQLVLITPDNLNIAATVPNVFIRSGAGTDALQAVGGINVLDGGTGSNFLTGGGQTSFYLDDRTSTADTWSTITNFAKNDSVTVWGITPTNFDIAWRDNQGVGSYTGLTMHATAVGQPTASLTLPGYSTADLTNGRLSISFGTVQGNDYMYVHENS
jgi:serralysin